MQAHSRAPCVELRQGLLLVKTAGQIRQQLKMGWVIDRDLRSSEMVVLLPLPLPCNTPVPSRMHWHLPCLGFPISEVVASAAFGYRRVAHADIPEAAVDGSHVPHRVGSG